jgi:hypothetical protein
MIDLGADPDTLMTIRHDGKDYDSFEPRPLGELAKWTIEESDKGGLKRRRWRPFSASRLVDIASPASADQAA